MKDGTPRRVRAEREPALQPAKLGLMAMVPMLMLAACGLEVLLTLSPPEFVATSDISDDFRIRITGENDEPEFRGVEFYYKLYGAGSAIPQSDINLQGYDDVVTTGFRRIASAGDEPGDIFKPLIKVPVSSRGKESEITVTFADIAGVRAIGVAKEAGAYEEPGLALRRSVIDSEDNYKAFDEFDAGDADIASLELSQADLDTGADVQIVLYALSYGRESLSREVFSRAVYLESIGIMIVSENY